MKRLIGTLIVLVAVCVTTSVASADPRHHHGHHGPAPSYAYRHGGANFHHGYGHYPHHNYYRPPVVSGYRGNYCPPVVPPRCYPPGSPYGGFNYQGRNFGFSFGY